MSTLLAKVLKLHSIPWRLILLAMTFFVITVIEVRAEDDPEISDEAFEKIIEEIEKLSPAHLGFFESKKHPLKVVENIEKSVFPIWVPSGDKIELKELAREIEISNDYQSLLNALDSIIKESEKASKPEIILIREQLLLCQKRELKES